MYADKGITNKNDWPVCNLGILEWRIEWKTEWRIEWRIEWKTASLEGLVEQLPSWWELTKKYIDAETLGSVLEKKNYIAGSFLVLLSHVNCPADCPSKYTSLSTMPGPRLGFREPFICDTISIIYKKLLPFIARLHSSCLKTFALGFPKLP